MDALGKLLLNLKTIAIIPKGKRITTAHEFINIEEDSFFQPAWRTMARDDRFKNVTFVQHVIDTIIMVSDLMLESKYLFLENITIEAVSENCDVVFGGTQPMPTDREKRLAKIKEIAYLLDESKFGVENLIETYNHDTNIVAILEPLLGKIDTHVSKICRVLMSMGEILKKRARY